MTDTNFNLSKDLLHELFEYRDGLLFRKKAYNFAQKSGEQVGKPTKDGRSYVFLNGKQYGTHQIVFVMHYGYLPKEIDHKDNNELNNKIENLREANRQEQLFNRRIARNNTSGHKNVHWCNTKKRWIVAFQIDKKVKRRSFKDYNEAVDLAKVFRVSLHGEFANHG